MGSAPHRPCHERRRRVSRSAFFPLPNTFSHGFIIITLTIVSLLAGPSAHGQTMILDQDAIKTIARRKGWATRMESPTRVIELRAIVNGIPLYNTTHNADAADTISTDECLPGGSSGLGLTGTGVTLGIWDAAAVRTSHQEFGGRATQSDSASVTHYHPTHVAGTMIAAGVNAAAAGMSPAASLDCYDWSLDVIEMINAATAGLRVSNHSYGFVLGWAFGDFDNGGTDRWFWFGDVTISTLEDHRFGLYNGFSQTQDIIAWDHPYYLICRSAGNDRDDDIPVPGTEHLVLINSEWQGSTDIRDPDGDYDSLGPRGVPKNVLTIGAVDDIVGGYAGPAGVAMTAYSSWGPTDDGRIKPDLVANGVNLFSATDTADIDYTTLSGTSMAAPNVSGSLGVLIQHWRNTHPTESDMRSATLKGLVRHTADEAGAADRIVLAQKRILRSL
ncbi:MAG: S8 family serine peptidase, partial [Phycisphaerae bacterium]